MATNRARGWMRAVALLAVAGVLPACGDEDSVAAGTPGTGTNTPINWVDTSLGAPIGTPGDTPLIWNDPNNAVAPGTFGVPSIDERTYAFPDHYVLSSDPAAAHPLMTATSSTVLTTPETTVWSQMYNQRLGIGGIGGVGGVGGIGGVGGVGNTTTPPLRDSKALRKNARAHGKHYAIYHAGFPLTNAETDTVATGGPPDVPGVPDNALFPGRLAKSELTVSNPLESLISGPNYATANQAAQYYLTTNAGPIANTAYTVVGVGYWKGGPEQNYWSAIFAWNAPIN